MKIMTHILQNVGNLFLNTSILLDAAQRRLKLSPETLWMIDWENHKCIMKQVRDRDYVIIKKMMWNVNPSQTVKHIYDKDISTACELCDESDLPVHFMRCAALRASPQVKKLFATLKSEISKTNTNPIFWNIIEQVLQEGKVSMPEGTPPEVYII